MKNVIVNDRSVYPDTEAALIDTFVGQRIKFGPITCTFYALDPEVLPIYQIGGYTLTLDWREIACQHTNYRIMARFIVTPTGDRP